MLQQNGVINEVLVWIGLVPDGERLILINNQFGTIVAMTHILLPFMILPMYSVMQTIPPVYLRAAKSMGATNWTKGVFISNRIAYHISSSLNWGLAAALGTILLIVVLALYWAYDRIVGIDNVKLG